MRYTATLLLLFLATCVICEHHEDDHNRPSPKSSAQGFDMATFTLLNPRQVYQAEKVIQGFLSRLAGPMKQPITLRSSKSNSLQRSIGQICERIRSKLIEFAEAYGLTTSVRGYKRSLSNVTLSEDWFTEIILRGSLVMYDLVNMAEDVWSSIDFHFDKNDAVPSMTEDAVAHAGGFQFLGTFKNATNISERLFRCLSLMSNKSQDKSSFDISAVLAKFARNTPNNVLKKFRSKLEVLPSKQHLANQKLHIFICHSVTNNNHEECIRALKSLDKCIFDPDKRPNNKTENHQFHAKSWLSMVEYLSECKADVRQDGKVYVKCNFQGKMPKQTSRQLKYVYERILNRRISKRSPLHRVINDLGRVLSKRTWGKRFTHELYQYTAIYQEGHRKTMQLAKFAQKDRKMIPRYKKIARALNLYKRGLLLDTMGAIGRMHRTAQDLEKFLINGIKIVLNETWHSHIRILTCITEWMTKLLDLYGYNVSDEEEATASISSEVSPVVVESIEQIDSDFDDSAEDQARINGSQEATISQFKKDKLRIVDASFRNLMQSMQRMSKFRRANDKSTLACLANNILLVAMFMETVGFVSTLFCLGHANKNESTASEIKDEWLHGRKRRSLRFLNLQPDIGWSSTKSKSFVRVYESFGIMLDNKVDRTSFENMSQDFTIGTYKTPIGFSNSTKKIF
ncbi:hypothetical protein KM043_006888 [Ampulex compressa]|nr:hypothetical protein KM043_006888 [Ampulex compressa]